MSSSYLLDEREGDTAVLLDEAGRPRTVPARLIPPDAPDGAALLWDEAAGCYRADPARGAARQAAMRARVRRLLGCE